MIAPSSLAAAAASAALRLKDGRYATRLEAVQDLASDTGEHPFTCGMALRVAQFGETEAARLMTAAHLVHRAVNGSTRHDPLVAMLRADCPGYSDEEYAEALGDALFDHR